MGTEPHRKLSDEAMAERDAKIKKLADSGVTRAALAQRFHISYNSVRFALMTEEEKTKFRTRRKNFDKARRGTGNVVDPDAAGADGNHLPG